MQAERKKTRRSQQRERLWHASLRAEDDPLRISTSSIQQSPSQLHAVWSEHWRSSGRRSKRKCAADAIRVRSWK